MTVPAVGLPEDLQPVGKFDERLTAAGGVALPDNIKYLAEEFYKPVDLWCPSIES